MLSDKLNMCVKIEDISNSITFEPVIVTVRLYLTSDAAPIKLYDLILVVSLDPLTNKTRQAEIRGQAKERLSFLKAFYCHNNH